MTKEQLLNEIKEKNQKEVSDRAFKTFLFLAILIFSIYKMVTMDFNEDDEVNFLILIIPWSIIISGIGFFYQKALYKKCKTIGNDPLKHSVFEMIDPDTLANVLTEINNNKVFEDGTITLSKKYLMYKDYDHPHFRIIYLKNLTEFNRFDHADKGIYLHTKGNHSYYLEYEKKDYNKIDTAKNELIKLFPKLNSEADELMTLSNNNWQSTCIPILLEELEDEPSTEERKEPKELKPVEGRRTTKSLEPTKVVKEKPVKKEELVDEEDEVVEEVEEKPKTRKKTTTKTTKTKEKDLNTKYDELKKLKELLDSDILTKEEFEKEKNKILKD